METAPAVLAFCFIFFNHSCCVHLKLDTKCSLPLP